MAQATDERSANRCAAALVRDGALDEADALARAVLAFYPSSADAFAVRGYVAAKRGAFADAVPLVEAAIAGRAEPLWLGLLADLLRNLYRLDEAEAASREAVRRATTTGRAHALSALGRVLTERGDLAGAASANLAILALEPDNPYAHFALGEALLAQGQWAPGWREYEWRMKLPGAPMREMPLGGIPAWNGMRLDAGRLLVVCDQGFGDTIQFSRFLPVAASRVGELVLACADALAGLIGRVDGVARVVSDWDEVKLRPSPYAAHVAISSLPYLLDSEGRTIGGGATLVANPERVAHWEQYLAAIRPGAPRVGLVWSGKPEHPNDRRRSLPFHKLLPVVTAGADTLFVSLNKYRDASDASLMEANNILDVADALPDFDETAGLMAALDALVTIDSAPAHLGGALGVPTWMLTPKPADWRWGKSGEQSCWYNRLRMIRQDLAGDWQAPIRKLVDLASDQSRGVWGQGPSGSRAAPWPLLGIDCDA